MRLCRSFFWSGMFVNIKEWVKSCSICQVMTKASNSKSSGLLQPLPFQKQYRWMYIWILSHPYQSPMEKQQALSSLIVYLSMLISCQCLHFLMPTLLQKHSQTLWYACIGSLELSCRIMIRYFWAPFGRICLPSTRWCSKSMHPTILPMLCHWWLEEMAVLYLPRRVLV